MNGLKNIADRTIGNTTGKEHTFYQDGDTSDIISVILHADQHAGSFTSNFAHHLKGSTYRETADNIWHFIKDHIQYERDRPGHERIKSPGKLWKDKKGDCKSFTVFTTSILQNLGIPYVYRFAYYPDSLMPSSKDVNHVYCVIFDRAGNEIIIDAVADFPNYEQPADYTIDYAPDGQILYKKEEATINGQTTKTDQKGWISLLWVALGLIILLNND